MTTPNYGLTLFVNNISKVSRITCSGHCQTPKEFKKQKVEKRKEKVVIKEIVEEEGHMELKACKRNVLEEEACEFLKLIK